MKMTEQQQALITDNLKFAYWLINGWSSKQTVIDRGELESIILEAFSRSAIKHDPARGGFLNYSKLHANHCVLEELRKRKTAQKYMYEVAIDNTTDTNMDTKAEHMDLHMAIDELPEPDQSILRDHYFKGLHLNEIALKNGISVSGVSIILKRCRNVLHKKIA